MGKKVGRREQKRRAQLEAVEDLVRRTAEAQRISVEEARAQLVEIARIREEYSTYFDGSGFIVKDVTFNPVTQQVEVVVVDAETGSVEEGRLRMTEREAAQVRAPRTALGRLVVAGGAPGLVPAPPMVIQKSRSVGATTMGAALQAGGRQRPR